jgi:hypothetical protein
MHIIIHLQKIHNKQYVRFATVANKQSYSEEYSEIYDDELTPENHAVFYNYDQSMYDRLIHDVMFKKFKNNGKLSHVKNEDDIVKGLFHAFEKDQDITEYTSWIKSRLESYEEDDDTSQIDASTETLKYIHNNIKEFINVSGKNSYTLQNCDYDDNVYYVTYHHILALIMAYVPIDKRFKEDESECDDTTIVKLRNGFTVDKLTLSPKNVALMIAYIPVQIKREIEMFSDKQMPIEHFNAMKNIYQHAILSSTNMTLADDIMNMPFTVDDDFDTQYRKFNDIEDVSLMFLKSKEFLSKARPTMKEFKLEMNYRGFIKDEDEAMLEELKQHVIDCPSTGLRSYPKIEMSPPKQIESEPEINYVYHNILANTIYIAPKRIKYLCELIESSKHIFKTKTIPKMLVHISKTENILDTIEDLKSLAHILEQMVPNYKSPNTLCEEVHDPSDEPTKNPVSDLIKQYETTKEYVVKYKDDNHKMSAASVVEQVYDYIKEQTKDNPITINKRLISVHMVELGVKKFRKANGYVYGIKDSQGTVLSQGNGLCQDSEDSHLSQGIQSIQGIQGIPDNPVYKVPPTIKSDYVEWPFFSYKPNSTPKILEA